MSEKAKFTRIYDDGESVCVEGPANRFIVKAQDIYEWKVDERAERRAQFACAAMRGLITRGLFDADPKGAATEALYFADALLAALEKAP